MASFGENLRRERELRGIDLHDVADQTKISFRFLQAIEQDRADVLPGGLFPRAFVRQYARYLGLDAERVVAEFVYARGEQGADPQAIPMRTESPRTGWIMAGALVAGGILVLIYSRPAQRVPPRVEAPPATTVIQESDRVYPPPSQAPQGAGTQAEGLVLTLNARQSCWVAAQVDGQTVINRVLSQGESETLEARGEIVLSVGNAGGLDFSVNERPGIPLGKSGEVRRNIVINKQNLTSLVEDPPAIRASHSS
jgi:cytoskeletal protein RodZ